MHSETFSFLPTLVGLNCLETCFGCNTNANYDPVDYVIAPQVTSPLRETKRFHICFRPNNFVKKDSMLSVSEVEDYFNWKLDNNGIPVSHYHDFKVGNLDSL